MLKREDINFFDSYSDKEETPSIDITNENFNIIFSMIDRVIGEPFIDETVYYTVAYFKDKNRKN